MNFTNLLRRCRNVSIVGNKPRRQRKPPRNLTAEPLEHRIVLTGELSESQRLALTDGLEAIGSLLEHANSTGKLGTTIPMLDASVGDAVDLGATFKSRLADPVEAWLSTHVDATVGDVIAAMNQTSGLVDGTNWTLTAVNASTATETLVNVTVAAETTADEVALIFPDSVYDLIFANLPETTLTADASWSFTLGLGTATNGAFHARFTTPLSVTFDVALEDLTLAAQSGLLGLNVGTYGGNESRVGIDADIGAKHCRSERGQSLDTLRVATNAGRCAGDANGNGPGRRCAVRDKRIVHRGKRPGQSREPHVRGRSLRRFARSVAAQLPGSRHLAVSGSGDEPDRRDVQEPGHTGRRDFGGQGAPGGYPAGQGLVDRPGREAVRGRTGRTRQTAAPSGGRARKPGRTRCLFAPGHAREARRVDAERRLRRRRANCGSILSPSTFPRPSKPTSGFPTPARSKRSRQTRPTKRAWRRRASSNCRWRST